MRHHHEPDSPGEGSATATADAGGVWAGVQAQRNDLMYLLIGCAHMLVLAGLIEGGFSQITAPIIPYFLKIFFAGALFATLIAYLFFIPLGSQGDVVAS